MQNKVQGEVDMIRTEDLKDTGKPGYRVGMDITLSMIRQKLEEINEEEYEMPIRFYYEQIKSGGLFNSSIEECLILENEEHSDDYFKYCITTRKQGKKTIIMMYYYGRSVLTGKARQTERRRETGGIGGMILNAFSGVNETEYAAEYDYYDMVEEMFREAFA